MNRLATFEVAMHVCDPALGHHSTRVTANAETVARRAGWNEERLAELRLGGALHDVGKINLLPEVLAKPAALDERELAHVRSHPIEGVWLLAGVRSLAPALPYVLFHHERWDGGGYPTSRAGRDIPLEGRLLAVVDAFDAMTSERPYRAALSVDEALGELERFAGSQFDPELVATFIEAYEAGEIEEPVPAAVAL